MPPYAAIGPTVEPLGPRNGEFVSNIFGEIRQIAFVVKDIDEAMEYWADTLGIGPFYVKRKIKLSEFRYRGKESVSPTISIALANSGFIQIELVQQHNDVPSIYKEFMSVSGQGLQHISSWVTREVFDNKRRELLEKGVEIAQEGVIPSSGVRLCYFETCGSSYGLIFEMADLKEPSQYERVMNIAKEAKKWDGSEPVREVLA